MVTSRRVDGSEVYAGDHALMPSIELSCPDHILDSSSLAAIPHPNERPVDQHHEVNISEEERW